VEAGRDAVDAVAVEGRPDLVDILLGELLGVVELVVVDQIAQPPDCAPHAVGGRFPRPLRLVAAGDEAGDHRPEGPDAEARLHSAALRLRSSQDLGESRRRTAVSWASDDLVSGPAGLTRGRMWGAQAGIFAIDASGRTPLPDRSSPEGEQRSDVRAGSQPGGRLAGLTAGTAAAMFSYAAPTVATADSKDAPVPLVAHTERRLRWGEERRTG
jgi:hypothetical protein